MKTRVLVLLSIFLFSAGPGLAQVEPPRMIDEVVTKAVEKVVVAQVGIEAGVEAGEAAARPAAEAAAKAVTEAAAKAAAEASELLNEFNKDHTPQKSIHIPFDLPQGKGPNEIITESHSHTPPAPNPCNDTGSDDGGSDLSICGVSVKTHPEGNYE